MDLIIHPLILHMPSYEAQILDLENKLIALERKVNAYTKLLNFPSLQLDESSEEGKPLILISKKQQIVKS